MIGLELLAKLTEREREVLALTLVGKSTKEIATLCGISDKTAETHRTNVNQKLGASYNDGLLRLAVIKGWVEVRRGLKPEQDHLAVLFDFQARPHAVHRGGPGRRAA